MNDISKAALDSMMAGMIKPTPQALHHQLGQLRNKMPSAADLGKPENSAWMGQVLAVVEAVGDALIDAAKLRTYSDRIANPALVEKTARKIALSIDTVLAKLELKLPTQAQGAFIPAGGLHTAYAAISKAVSGATSFVLIVDPYADDTLITDFVALVPEKVEILLLSDAHSAKPSLKPAAERWIAQYGATRPLEVRLAAAKSLHDRLIVVDEKDVWVLGQSLKDLAKRAHSSLVRMDAESGALKLQAHVDIWKAATKLA
jgi:hypothetical protein